MIDATTQTSSTGDTNPSGPEIVLSGEATGGGTGIAISGDSSGVEGLVVNGFGTGIAIGYGLDFDPSQNQVRDNYLGTDPTGTSAVPNRHGLSIQGFGSPFAQGSQNVAERNLISGNQGEGLALCDAARTRVRNNRIGVDRTGDGKLGNGSNGLLLGCAGDPSSVIEDNVIAFNGGEGFRDEPDYRFSVAFTPDGHQGNALRRNSIHSNEGLGVNLLPPPFGAVEGVTPNDPCDPDGGSNLLQNFPVLDSARTSGAGTTVAGTLNSTPNRSFEVELFSNDAADPSGFGEGQRYLGSVSVSTDSSCNASFSRVLSAPVPAGKFVTATATDAADNTSEFSKAVEVPGDPPACSDRRDNDEDGRTDHPDDPGCSSADDDNETDRPRACSDGRDNDGDRRTDHPSDPGCSSPDDDSESPDPRSTCTINGTAGNDVIRGTPGDDVICAGSGNDIVYGRGGNDTVRGGPGNDILRGGDGEDRLFGDPGRDTLYGNGGTDALHTEDGRRGNDIARGGAGADSCATDPGDVRSSC